MLLKEFLEPMGMTQVALAKHLGWTWARLNEIVNGRRGVTASSALALGETFGTGLEFWLNLQRDWDPWHAMKKHKPVVALRKAS
jgi:addiction module HigA family antidote